MLKEKLRRHYWMDALRGIAVLLVIVQHSVTVPLFDGYQSLDMLGRLNEALAPYRVPMLLALSGMLLHRSLGKGLPKYAIGKLQRIAWPLALWTPIVLALSPKLWGSLSAWVGPRHLWFLVVLLFCYAVGVLALRINAGWICIALVVLYSIPAVSTTEGSHILWYGSYFMVGAWVVPYLHRWQGMPAWVAALLGVMAAGWAWAAATGAEVIAPLEFVFSLTGLGALLWVGTRLPRMPWAEWVGQRSIVFYVVHVPVMLIILRLINDPNRFGPVPITLILLIAGGMGALLFTSRWTQWMFAFPSFGKNRIATSEADPSRVVDQ